MVYNELPVLEEVIADGPFLNQCITECQLHSTEFYECLTTTENTIRDSVLTGKEYNKYVKNLSVALEDAADILPDHTTALEKVRILRGGDKGYFFVKLDFEIAVDQQTRTGDPTFGGDPDSDRPPVPAGQPRPYLVPIWPNFGKSPKNGQSPNFMCFTCS